MANDNLGNIERAILVTLPKDGIADEAEVQRLVEQFRNIFPISDDERDALIRKLHARLAIKMDLGTAIVEKGHLPWLLSRKPKINPFFWDRYSKYLFREGWPPGIANTLDRVTDEVLDLLGDPIREGTWGRRGLVMGDVQSGKTATYTALCCKAADTGYRLVILLTGTLESLRRQTQERLDAGFVGLDSSGLLSQQRQRRAVGAGLLDQSRAAGVFTSRLADFSKDRMTQLNFRLNAFNEPILVVVKKNKKILQNLENWLRDYNANAEGKIDTPVLLIDDEADNASVNTRSGDQDPTAVNERIRALLQLFYRSSYVGFTATPFANIFIDPDSDHDMIGNDLFPRDFIYALEAPTNYIGPDKIFADDSLLNALRVIEDAESVFPLKHKSSLVVDALPSSLEEAVRVFVITNAIRDLRDEGTTHRSMLINVSRFTDVQTQVAQLVDEKLRVLQSDIRNYSKLSALEALRNRNISALKSTYEKEFSDSGISWPDVQNALLQAALPVVVKAVNQRTGAASLDYSSYREHGLRVIAVGGNSLSRGLTLEGLSTSYFFRNSQMYDTLLQMGRWFGYRDGYEDLCALWLTEEAMHWYAHITLAVEELREEIKRMFRNQLTPKDFGLKVRAHPDSLIVTARNKMRTAQTIVRDVSLSCTGLETPRLYSNANRIGANASALRDLILELGKAGIAREESPWESKNSLWRNVPRQVISGFLRRFASHPLNFSFQNEDLAAFIEKTAEPKLRVWDIVLPNGDEKTSEFAGIPYRPQRRNVTTDSGSILVSGSKARVGSRGVEREGIDKDVVEQALAQYRALEGKRSMPDHKYREVRARPLLLLHIVSPYLDERPLDTGGTPLVALGLSFPTFDDHEIASRAVYRVNLVEWRNLFELEADDDDPDEEVGGAVA
jgi:hypothetical protein